MHVERYVELVLSFLHRTYIDINDQVPEFDISRTLIWQEIELSSVRIKTFTYSEQV